MVSVSEKQGEAAERQPGKRDHRGDRAPGDLKDKEAFDHARGCVHLLQP
jgi:hypothetical protein